jgi:hypothetical protein
MKSKTLIMICALTSTLTIVLWFLWFDSTRSFNQVELTINSKGIINQKELTNFTNILSKYNSKLTQDELIKIFEREREHYVVIITILVGILTIFTVFVIFKSLIEKDEFDKYKKELLILKNDTKYHIMRYEYDSLIFAIDKNMSLYPPNSTEEVTNVESFAVCLNYYLNSFYNEAKEINKLKEFFTDNNFIYNLLFKANEYVSNNYKKIDSKSKWDIEKNKLLHSVIENLSVYFNKKKFNVIIEELESTLDRDRIKYNFGRYSNGV